MAIVIFMLALNLTVAAGTLNGILFYANIIATNIDTYIFFHFSHPIPLATVLVSWLEIGFDVCIYKGMASGNKAFPQLIFPSYIIILTIIVIVVSQGSSKFANII